MENFPEQIFDSRIFSEFLKFSKEDFRLSRIFQYEFSISEFLQKSILTLLNFSGRIFGFSEFFWVDFWLSSIFPFFGEEFCLSKIFQLLNFFRSNLDFFEFFGLDFCLSRIFLVKIFTFPEFFALHFDFLNFFGKEF